MVLTEEQPWPGQSMWLQCTPTPLGAGGGCTSALTHRLPFISEASSCFTQQLHWIFFSGFLLHHTTTPALWGAAAHVSVYQNTAQCKACSLHPSQPAGEGLLMESSFHAGFGRLPFLLRGLCKAAHQHCPPEGSSSLETGSKTALEHCSLPCPLLFPTRHCSSPSW